MALGVGEGLLWNECLQRFLYHQIAGPREESGFVALNDLVITWGFNILRGFLSHAWGRMRRKEPNQALFGKKHKTNLEESPLRRVVVFIDKPCKVVRSTERMGRGESCPWI